MNERARKKAIDMERVRRIIDDSDKELITAMLVTSGVRASKIGFEYLKIAVQLYRAYGGVMEKICKVIAVAYATNYATNYAAIEKDMRKALEEAGAREIKTNFNRKIGSRVFRGGETITPKEYVAVLSECMDMPNIHEKFCLKKVKNRVVGDN